ncbi:MAG: SDR family NAD(P)-dependent oxidoreductase [Cyclobacteriaceae bacterium]
MIRTILITGSTDGIGKLTAIKLAKAGHEIYLHGRNQEKLTDSISMVKKESGNESIQGFVADLSDLGAVRELARQVHKKLAKLDVLINNAGVYNSPQATTKDGLDIRFMVNYIAPYVLTYELVPLLRKGNDARIVNLSSAAQASVNFDALYGGKVFSQGDAYAQSKLAITMWSLYQAGQLDDIAVIAVNPGSLLQTKMALEAFGNFWSPAAKGVDILYDLATSYRYEEMNGKYFDNDGGNFGTAHPDAYNPDKIKQLIDSTESMLKG